MQGILRHGFRLEAHVSEDVFQDVFTRVYLRLDDVRDDHAVRPWIAQIARNATLDWLRQSRREIAVGEERDADPVDEPLSRVEEALEVRDALSRLPAHQQEILDRFFTRDESYRAIGEALSLPAGTIASRISRALGALRAELEVDG